MGIKKKKEGPSPIFGSTPETSAYLDGLTARRHGQKVSQNPFQKGSLLYYAWLDGYMRRREV